MTLYEKSPANIAEHRLTGYETLSVWETIKAFKMNSLICFLVTLSAATDGLIGNIIAEPGFVEKLGTQRNDDGDVVLSSPVMSVWGSLGSGGQIIGMVTLPFLSDRFGRKTAMYYYCFMLAVSVILESNAQTWQVWLVSKFFGGIGVGCLQSTIPIYVSEVAPIRARGVFLMGYSLWWITGQFFAPVALQVMAERDPNNYLTPVYTQWSQIGLMFIIYLVIPEPPAWCVTRGKVEQAKKSLRFIYRGVTDFDIEHAYNLLVINVEHERAVAVEQRSEKWYAIFKGIDGKRTLVSCWTLMTQQFIGLGVFFTYGSYFFQQAGIKDHFKVTCITSGINIAASTVVIYLADITGRRSLACIGTTICMVCNIGVGILGVVPQVKASNILLVFFSYVGLVANGAAGWGFIGEISSQRLRHYTSGFAAASTCIWNWGLKTCWFFAGVGFPFTVAMWFLIPETSGHVL
ncbi:general substrate transporter [Dactylonectria estremocensis]|uniref:General substrate transporter n=1 Tax=Dactylonectria estremocensis TaxID=1079267 RepID=A0A9P9FHK4_9HYPO|nr:general substrate transporter [Dactylonectria estremocensis]